MFPWPLVPFILRFPGREAGPCSRPGPILFSWPWSLSGLNFKIDQARPGGPPFSGFASEALVAVSTLIHTDPDGFFSKEK